MATPPKRMVITGGVLIGALCAIWTYVMGFTGWHKHPTLLFAFFLVIPIEIGVLFWGLRKTSGENGYWRQVSLGTAMAVIGGVLLFLNSLLFTNVVFPEYLSELRASYGEILKGQGKTEAEIAVELARQAESQTPLRNAFDGFVGTAATGFLASLAIAAFARKR